MDMFFVAAIVVMLLVTLAFAAGCDQLERRQ